MIADPTVSAAPQKPNPVRRLVCGTATILILACGPGRVGAAAPPIDEGRSARSGDKAVVPLAEVQSQLASRTAPNPMIHAQGTRIVDGRGNEIRLCGVNLEGWLMWNGPLWGAGLTSETAIAKRLEQMAGKEFTDQFRIAVYDNFITEADIQMIAEMGFNTVRVPFNHTVLEDGNPLEAYTASGWGYLDRLLEWCERHRVYAVLDMHSAPGGQTGLFVADPDPVRVWDSPAKQQQTVDLWKAIATRYRDRQIVAGYDLLNEPDAPKPQDLIGLYRRIITAIRAVDPDHMVILEGNKIAASDFSPFKGPIDANQVYSFHTYNFLTDGLGESTLRKYAKMAESHNVPIWNGEFGAHKASWVNGQVRLFEDPQYHVCGWIFWPWKRVAEGDEWQRERYRGLTEIQATPDWVAVAGGISSWFGPGSDITQEVARKGMNEFIIAIKAANLVTDMEMKKILNSHRTR